MGPFVTMHFVVQFGGTCIVLDTHLAYSVEMWKTYSIVFLDVERKPPCQIHSETHTNRAARYI